MAGKTFKIEVVTPDRTVYAAETESVVAPAHEGYLGVLAGHRPMLCTLQPGELRVRTEKGESHLSVSGGFLEVSATGVIVLADSAEPVSDIDATRAQKAAARAKERLAKPGKDLDRDRAEFALARAQNRLALARKYAGR